jgi:hypothetical protein
MIPPNKLRNMGLRRTLFRLQGCSIKIIRLSKITYYISMMEASGYICSVKLTTTIAREYIASIL